MKLFNLLFLVLLTSCAAQKVAVHVEVFKPYCGGAKPTPEMARGERTPYSNQKIAVFRRSIDKDSAPILVKWIDLDSLGKWIGPLKPGTYDLYRSDKILSMEEIEQKYRKQYTACNLSTYWIEPLQDWMNGESVASICSTYGIYEGNMIRSVLKLNNMLEEWRCMAKYCEHSEMLMKFTDVEKLLLREAVIQDSLYLHLV